MKKQRPVEDSVIAAEDAKSVLSTISAPKWFAESCKQGDVQRLRDNATFVSAETARELIERARILSVAGAYQALRSYATRFLASFNDADWGGRHAN
jgi:hypothetical protein